MWATHRVAPTDSQFVGSIFCVSQVVNCQRLQQKNPLGREFRIKISIDCYSEYLEYSLSMCNYNRIMSDKRGICECCRSKR